MDGKPVYVLLLILASSPQSHLKALSRLSWLLQQESFRASLRKKPDTDELTGIIKQYYA
jgi:mannitol/fructose-specific phosphotransferase system IIA component (Ntr-type)